MKKILSITGAVLLSGAGIALAADVSSARDAMLKLIKADAFLGRDTFCVDLSHSRNPMPGDVVLEAGDTRRDALARAGLLDKNHRLTEAGWEQIDLAYDGCLVAGQYSLELKSISPEQARQFLAAPKPASRIEVSVRVHTTVGKLAPWARSLKDPAEIPEVASLLRGLDLPVTLVHEDGRWRAELVFDAAAASQIRIPHVHASVLSRNDKVLLAKFPPLNKAVLLQLWLKDSADWVGARACVTIAGSEQFPVDEVIVNPVLDRRLTREGFAVAIYEMLERDPRQQKVLSLTLPRLELLVRAGVLSSSATKGPKYGSQLPGQLYVLVPGHEKYVLEYFGGACLYAGIPEVLVTAIKYQGMAGRMVVRARYTQLAPWATREVLDGMPDLRKAAEHGLVCLSDLNLDASGWQAQTGGCR